MIQVPDTVIARLNELAKGEPEHFIFADRKVHIIGDANLTGVDTSGNQEPPQTQVLDDIEVTIHIEVNP